MINRFETIISNDSYKKGDAVFFDGILRGVATHDASPLEKLEIQTCGFTCINCYPDEYIFGVDVAEKQTWLEKIKNKIKDRKRLFEWWWYEHRPIITTRARIEAEADHLDYDYEYDDDVDWEACETCDDKNEKGACIGCEGYSKKK